MKLQRKVTEWSTRWLQPESFTSSGSWTYLSLSQTNWLVIFPACIRPVIKSSTWKYTVMDTGDILYITWAHTQVDNSPEDNHLSGELKQSLYQSHPVGVSWPRSSPAWPTRTGLCLSWRCVSSPSSPLWLRYRGTVPSRALISSPSPAWEEKT